ncbi:hypothetical protein CK203_053814 [Vitis vinifera]|uniref:Uncharacterized protein n=1 Tax=Vitis vinifera TaxID=29760 RepID=A0A438GRH3_VITVI|nr:hypothetical protein CK203_053814 [Vitis vinifera]
MGGAASPPVQDRPFPHLRGNPFSAPIPHQEATTDPVPPADQARRPASRPPAKRTKVSAPGEPSHAPQAEPPTEDSRILVGIPLETVIRRPMIAGPPIDDNLDCRARSFHSEIYFDIEALRQQPELRDSFRLLQRYHMEHLLTPRQFYYPRVVLDFYQSMTTHSLRDPTLIQFTIDGRQAAIGARHIAEALPSVLTRRELPSGMLLIDVLLRANIFPLQHKVQRRGAILEALFRISEGYYFGPHHLIMTSLLHFEEKVHQKKLQRADGIPLLFPRLLCQILEHLGYPEEPRLERRRHCREDFSLDKWHHLSLLCTSGSSSCASTSGAQLSLHLKSSCAPTSRATPDEQLPQAQQDEILTDTTPPAPAAHTSVHMPEAIHPTSPLTQGAPPVMPATQHLLLHLSPLSPFLLRNSEA